MISLFNCNTETQWCWMEFKGTDATDFLNRMTTLSPSKITSGKGEFGFFLNATGAIQASFQLLALNNNRYAFEFDGGFQGQTTTLLQEWIQRYQVADDVQTTLNTDLKPYWIFSDELHPL